MAITTHVYQIHIAAEPPQVWAAITESDWLRRYFHDTAYVARLVEGQTYRSVLPDGSPAIDGVIEVLTPPTAEQPGRLVQTWHIRYDAELAAEAPGRVEWTVERVGDGLTRVQLVHGDLALSPKTWAHVKDGWVWVLDALKTVLETGRSLPRAQESTPSSDPGAGDWHRAQGIETNNRAWELLGQPASPERDEDLLRTAYASAYHWQRATGTTPANDARAAYMISKALLATGQAAPALASADRCATVCRDQGLVDFDLAYAHEARARALAALGRQEEAALATRDALAVPIADAEDKAIVDGDFADLPDLIG